MDPEACPSADDWSAFVSDALDSGRRGELSDHAAGCSICHALISELVDAPALAETATPDGATPRPARGARLDPGTRIERYVIERELGAGGMGVVYVARDPELDRRVAIKLISRGASNDRLRREAQALAKLDHPNVVTVYDVGEHDGQSFVAMALVEGKNLRHWRRDEHPVREVIRVLIAAGRGLSAAHAAGFIHRDLKPDNIFVSDRGHVMVGDFGLARTAADEVDRTGGVRARDIDSPELSRDRSLELTATGTLIGTPAYMAPEQARGEPTTASDQFAFCVTAWETLFGVRPFAGKTFAEILAAVERGTLAEPVRDPGVPASVKRALQRGLSHDPARRWPEMDALLAELTGDRIRRRRNAVLVGTAAIALVAGAWGFARITSGGTEEAPRCRTSDERLASVWTSSRRAELVAAVVRAAPFAQTAAERAMDGLDRYALRWRQSWDDTCRDKAGEVTQAGFDLRVACLERRLGALSATVGTIRIADRATARNILGVASGLPSIDPCDDVIALRKIPPPPDQVAPQVAAVEAAIERAEVLRLAGKPSDAVALLTTAERDANATAYAPAIARATYSLGRSLATLERYPETKAKFEAALNQSIAAGDDDTAARAYVGLMGVASAMENVPRAKELAATADAAIRRLGDPAELRTTFMMMQMTTPGQEGKFAEALAIVETALGRLRAEGRAEEETSYYRFQALLLSALERLAEARAAYDRGVERTLAIYGANHPQHAEFLRMRAELLMFSGEYARGIADTARAYQILLETLGPDDATTVDAEVMVANIDGLFGRFDSAIARQRHVIAVKERVGGKDHAAIQHRSLAELFLIAGRFDDADAELKIALEAHTRLGLLPEVTWDELHLARARFGQRRFDEAFALAERARDGLVKLFPETHPGIAEIWIALGRIQIARGQPADAIRRLATVTSGFHLAEAKLVTADALWRTGDRPAAEAAFRAGIAALDQIDPKARPDLRAEIARLRAAHPP